MIQALDLDWLATEKGLARGDHSTGRQRQKTKEEQETHVTVLRFHRLFQTAKVHAFWPFNSTEVLAALWKEQSRAKSKRRIVEIFIGLRYWIRGDISWRG